MVSCEQCRASKKKCSFLGSNLYCARCFRRGLASSCTGPVPPMVAQYVPKPPPANSTLKCPVPPKVSHYIPMPHLTNHPLKLGFVVSSIAPIVSNNVAHHTVTDVPFHGVIPHAESTDVSSCLVNTSKAVHGKKKYVNHRAGHGVCYIPQASTSSTNRQKAAYKKSRLDTFTSQSRGKKNKARRYALKAKKQKSHLLSIDLPPLMDRSFITKQGMSTGIVFVDGGNEGNPPIRPVIPVGDSKHKKDRDLFIIPIRNLRVPTTHLSNHKKGLHHKMPDRPSDIILVPREASLTHTAMNKNLTSNSSLCDALDFVEMNMSASHHRGAKRHVVRDGKRKYVCIGPAAKRAGVGIRPIHPALAKTPSIHQERIHKYFRGVEHLFEMYVDTDEIRHILAAITFVNATTFSIPSRARASRASQSSRIYGAIACGVNVYLNVHKDQDFTYCAVSIHMREEYTLSQRIVAYFTFPNLGIAIPLRPGDVLFFNPQEDHCVSSRCNNDDDIYCMSLYFKSNLIGKNNNSLPLTNEEEFLVEEFNRN